MYSKLLLCYDSENEVVKNIFDVLHDSREDGDSFIAFISTRRQNGVWANELDASLVSYVFELNIIIISNVVGCEVFNSIEKLNGVLGVELPTNRTLWMYHHRCDNPVNPGPRHVLNHFCALVPKDSLSLDERAVAYTPGTKMVAKNLN